MSKVGDVLYSVPHVSDQMLVYDTVSSLVGQGWWGN